MKLEFSHPVLLDAVFHESDYQSQNSAGREARKPLQNPLRDEVGVVLDVPAALTTVATRV